jgi:hypothetical protein
MISVLPVSSLSRFLDSVTIPLLFTDNIFQASTSSALREEDDVTTAGVPSVAAALFLLLRSSHFLFPTRVSKCGATEVTSCPAVSMVLRILLRYASTTATVSIHHESGVQTGEVLG